MASLQEITARLREMAGREPWIGKTIKLDFHDEGCIVFAGAEVTNIDQPADCTFALSKSDFEDIARGRLDPAMAMMRGRLKVAGDLSLAMALKSLFERAHG